MKYVQILVLICCSISSVYAQDTTLHPSKADTTVGFGKSGLFTLPEVMVRTNFNYEKLLQQIKEDTSFYKAFRNLRILGYSAYNDIQMKDKTGNTIASLYSKIRQNYVNGCRTMDVLEEKNNR